MYTLTDYRRAALFFLAIALIALFMTSCGHWQCTSDKMSGYTDAKFHAVKGPKRISY